MIGQRVQSWRVQRSFVSPGPEGQSIELIVLPCLKQVACCSCNITVGYILGFNTVCFHYLKQSEQDEMDWNECGFQDKIRN